MRSASPARAGQETAGQGLARFAIVEGNGVGITAADPVLYHAALVQVRWPSPAWTQDSLKMSDPPATIAKRPVHLLSEP